MRKKIENALLELGITPNLRGFGYICRAVEIILASQGKMRVVEGLYAEIAKECDSSIACVERAIRHAFTKVDVESRAFIQYLGTDKLTNSALLYTLAYRLREG